MSLRTIDDQSHLELGIGQARAVARIAKMIRELFDDERAVKAESERKRAA